LVFFNNLVPPDVYTPRIKSSHSIGDTVILECFIDANPEPDIRWLHQFPDNINEEMDLSRQFYQGFDNNNNNRRDKGIWSIKQEQLNATRWKISLFIKVNASFIIFSKEFISFTLFL
jgi:hypothetical protein